MNKLEKAYVITGSNKGIGYGLLVGLCKKFLEKKSKSIIFATSRQEKLGIETVNKVIELYPDLKNQILYQQLDITKKESIDNFVGYLTKNNQKIDILFNNAGILIRDDKRSNLEVTREVLNTNYHCTVDFTENLIPLINPYGHIINVSSKLGTFIEISNELKKRFDNDKITIEELNELEKDFLKACVENRERELGWINEFNWPNSYCISKIFLNAYSRQLAWKLLEKKIRVNAFTPGWCRTDMGGSDATNDIHQGASTGIIISELEDNDDWSKSYCKYYSYEKVANW